MLSFLDLKTEISGIRSQGRLIIGSRMIARHKVDLCRPCRLRPAKSPVDSFRFYFDKTRNNSMNRVIVKLENVEENHDELGV